MLNDNNKEFKSTQFEGTYSEASDGHYDVGTTNKLDAAPSCHNPTYKLIDDRLDLIAQLLLSNLTAAPPYNPTSKLISNRFDIASQLLLSNCTNGIANSFNSSNNNNSVINNKYPLLTKQQRPPSSCSNPTLDCDSLDKLEDNYVFNVIATNDDKDAQPSKQQRLPAVSCRYPSPANTIFKIQEDEINQA